MRALAIITALATLAVAACGDGGPNDPPPPISGTYTLQTVDGSPLPLVLVESGSSDRMTIVSGFMTLAEAGTFTISETVRFTSGGSSADMTFTDSGTFTRNGSTLTFSMVDPEEGPSSFVGTLSGNTLTVTEEGISFVFRR